MVLSHQSRYRIIKSSFLLCKLGTFNIICAIITIVTSAMCDIEVIQQKIKKTFLYTSMLIQKF